MKSWREFTLETAELIREKYGMGQETAIAEDFLDRSEFYYEAFINGMTPEWALNWDGTYPDDWVPVAIVGDRVQAVI